jgi:hypothetical protein
MPHGGPDFKQRCHLKKAPCPLNAGEIDGDAVGYCELWIEDKNRNKKGRLNPSLSLNAQQ